PANLADAPGDAHLDATRLLRRADERLEQRQARALLQLGALGLVGERLDGGEALPLVEVAEVGDDATRRLPRRGLVVLAEEGQKLDLLVRVARVARLLARGELVDDREHRIGGAGRAPGRPTGAR